MCPECQREYDDPLGRRFHAQPNACPVCGPRVWLARPGADREMALRTPKGPNRSGDILRDAASLLQGGAILALKGLGGFHLACDATNDDAVQTLRLRKHRPAKPLAVMMSTLEDVQRHCTVTEDEAALLNSAQRPIVLLRWRSDSNIARAAAPGNCYLGVMLPYTPLHHLLLADVGRPLVMTSGNLAEEPIAQSNEEAWERLRKLSDCFLLHDRGIYARYDDSVWTVPAIPEPTPQPVRRSRGYAPFPIKLPFRTRPVLACGPELKNTFCATRDEYAFLSQHIGDMENLETLEHFESSIEVYRRLFRLRPEALVHDLHPDYLATRYAVEAAAREGIPALGVQHHHAHIAACMAEHRVTEPVIGVAMDGTGYGLDGRIWGGEALVADLRGFKRAVWLEYLPLPGGDAAIRNPCRIALAYVRALLGSVPQLPFMGEMGADEVRTVLHQVERRLNSPRTSSCGRLFDAVAALVDVRGRVTFEAQAAIEFEMLSAPGGEPYPFDVVQSSEATSWGNLSTIPATASREVKLAPLFTAVVDDVLGGRPTAEIGGRFHATVAALLADLCSRVRVDTGLKRVALSGGCFQNRLLLEKRVSRLRMAGLEPLVHRLVPCNDGGVSLGQAVVGHFMLERLTQTETSAAQPADLGRR